jgi:hypothetical protein
MNAAGEEQALQLPGVNLKRLFRAFVTAADYSQPKITAFIEAATREAAVRKLTAHIAILEYRKLEEVAERIYNCYSAAELIDEGLSGDRALRLFETGWSGGKATHYVESPLVLTTNPGALLRLWARIPTATEGQERQP